MLNLLKEIILDNQNNQLFTGTHRHLKVTPVNKKATIIIGVRRCGKSTWLNQAIEGLISKGVSKENILYINFFDDRLTNLKQGGLDTVLEAYFTIYPEKKTLETVYCFFDEIQVIQGWEAFVDRMLRTENCEIYITGSSAKMLSKEIASQMRGRALSWELFPFSFSEYLWHCKIGNHLPASSQQRHRVENAFGNFYEQGGFPEVVGVDRHLRIKIHQEYVNSILFRDLIERYDISHPRAVVDLARRLMENISSLYTLNGLSNYLKSIGHKAPKNAVADYLTWFEDAYFLFTVRLFSASYGKSNANPKKIYSIDHALIRSVTSGILVKSGHLLENIVYIALRRKNNDIYYYKTATNQEIDFLVQDQQQKIKLIQVCETLANPRTRQRETHSLENAMNELGLSDALIITREESEQLTVKNGKITVIPVWKFLLETSMND